MSADPKAPLSFPIALGLAILPAMAASLIGVMLEKPHKRVVQIEADYVGFKCPDEFVVGYGMDVAHNFRELPFIGVVA